MRSPTRVAPMAGKDHDVVHIDQRTAGKGGKALDAIDQADRLLGVKRQNAESLRAQGEFAHQVAPGMLGQGMAPTGWVACVGVEQVDDRSRVRWIVVVRSNDSQGVHFASVKHNVTMRERTWRTAAMLGTAQTLAFASTYYLPAVLADSMARDLGVSAPVVFAAFSLAMLVSAPLGPLTGRAIDRHGGHVVLPLTSLVFATGLGALALAQGPWSLFAAWAVMGLAMGSGLYEAAFSALVRIYGSNSRGAITGITLVAGFASTVGWPLSAWMEARWGWRGACAGWAAAHLLLGLPLNAALPRHTHPASHCNPTERQRGRWRPATAQRASQSGHRFGLGLGRGLCHRLVHQHRHGHPFAPPAATCRTGPGCRNQHRGAGGSSPGRRPAGRVRPAQTRSPAALGPRGGRSPSRRGTGIAAGRRPVAGAPSPRCS
jgi:hypothetical protein